MIRTLKRCLDFQMSQLILHSFIAAEESLKRERCQVEKVKYTGEQFVVVVAAVVVVLVALVRIIAAKVRKNSLCTKVIQQIRLNIFNSIPKSVNLKRRQHCSGELMFHLLFE